MPTFSPSWPGPALLVPITLDALLVGTPNQSSGSLWAQTGVAYGTLSRLGSGVTPFQKKTPPAVGAHLLWTLPFGVRHGSQSASGDEASKVTFPFAPNRWAILRSFVPPDAHGQPQAVAPVLTAGVLLSDSLHPLGASDTPYPDNGRVSGIGQYVPLAQWDGSAPASPFIQASGPGDVSWSAAYDNIRNVFGFHDDLTAAPPGFYGYQVVGWYSSPTADPLSHWSTADEWKAGMQQLGWGVGQDAAHALPATAVAGAQAAWTAWQAAHGLDGVTFTAANIDPALVPGQFATLMRKWGAYYSANGTATLPAPQLQLPAQTLCHGAVLGVNWQGPGYGYPSGAATGGANGPTVAIGNTPGEAVGAWMANWIDEVNQGGTDVAQLELALEAFQKGLIFDLGHQPVETAASLHQARFGGDPGGSTWTVVRPTQDPSAASGEGNALATGGGANATVPLNPTQLKALIALNSAQEAADTAAAQCDALLWELWALFYKRWYIKSFFATQYSAQVTSAIVALIGDDALSNKGPLGGLLGPARQAVLRTRATATTAVQTLHEALEAEAATKRFVVKQINEQSFWQPADPVVLVAGARADNKHAPPGSYGTDGFVFTRFTGQTLTALTITAGQAPHAPNPVTLGWAEMQAAAQLPGAATTPAMLALPKEIPDLWAEMLLVDTSNSRWLAQLFATGYQAAYGSAPPLDADAATQLIAAQQTTLWNDLAQLGVAHGALAAVAQFTGVPPNIVAFEDGTTQPWSPLYLDWEVEWHPTPLDEQGFPADWQLGGLDYEYTGAAVPTASVLYTGRATINPLISQTIAQQLEGFVTSDPDFDTLPDYIRNDLTAIQAVIPQFDFVSQALSGLTQQLLTRQPAPNLAVPAAFYGTAINPDVPSLVQQAQSHQPIVLDASGSSPAYSPLRAGHFRLTNLWVVDAYGQVLALRGAHDSVVHLHPATTVQPPAGSAFADFVQLPPRFTQSARLNFDLVAADDDAQPTNSADATSPICGWVTTNHLDDSLMVYDAAGNSLGAVIAISKDDHQTGLRWDATPGSDQPLGAPPDLPNAHLQGFVDSLLLAGAAGTEAFRQLLDVIDASYWNVVGAGQSRGGSLSALVGRPLAIVRARLDIDLLGDPALALDQDISQSGNAYPPAPPPDFTTTPFSVRVGDDAFATNGVMGYFLGDDYDTFYSVTAAPGATATLRRALATGGDPAAALRQLAAAAPVASATTSGGYVVGQQSIPLAPKRRAGASLSPASVHVTVLMDPHGRIPVVSGAFPVQYGDLPPGPVQSALSKMNLSFRVGPVLLDPAQIRMPLPSEIHGNWSWLARQSVTSWAPGQQPKQDGMPRLPDTPPRLREGWLLLDDPPSS